MFEFLRDVLFSLAVFFFFFPFIFLIFVGLEEIRGFRGVGPWVEVSVNDGVLVPLGCTWLVSKQGRELAKM